MAHVVVRDRSLPPRGAAIVAAQAAEKALKAVLVFAGIDPPWSHDVTRLAGMVDADLRARLATRDVAALTDAQLARYPDYGDLPLAHEEAERLVEEAAAIVDAVITALHKRGLEVPQPG